ncbi:MAG: FHA domain-containing protein [Bacteroidales bacterium]|nr:FHA domain-containing protein [Bacteroidales bacterium]
MKLITVGSSQNATIRLNSSFVSSVHAEIILIDNGDIILTDKNSKNGTYIQNQRIEPNKEIVVRRGDSIRFADVYLDWNSVPKLPPIDHNKIKGIYGVGTNPRNTYRLVGNTVSRFHATLTETKSGKWFIRDHSTNGTTVNGKKLTPETDYPIKANDVIVCGGVSLHNPIPSRPNNGLWKFVVAAVAVVLVGFGVWKIFSTPSLEKMATASALVYGEYYYVVELEDDPFVNLVRNWPKKYYFGVSTDKEDEGKYIVSIDYRDVEPIHRAGTAFFISDDGKMVTNRHVVCPWHEYVMDEELRDDIMQAMTMYRNKQITTNQLTVDSDLERLTNTDLGLLLCSHMAVFDKNDEIIGWKNIDDVNAYIMRYKTSRVKISGEVSYIGVGVANRKYNSYSELEPCTILKTSDNPDTDLAIMQLNVGTLPRTVEFTYNLDKCVMDQKNLKVQKESFYILGYPRQFELNLDNLNKGLTPMVYDCKISRVPSEFTFELQGEAIEGSSGSPVCKKNGTLVGVLYSKSGYLTTGSFGVHAKYAKELNDKIY